MEQYEKIHILSLTNRTSKSLNIKSIGQVIANLPYDVMHMDENRKIGMTNKMVVIENNVLSLSDITSPISHVFTFRSDPCILRGIITNMLRIALETEISSQEGTITYHAADEKAQYSVHKVEFMNTKVSSNISIPLNSKTGIQSGLGAFNMQLIHQDSLKGLVCFSTHPYTGTTFTIDLH